MTENLEEMLPSVPSLHSINSLFLETPRPPPVKNLNVNKVLFQEKTHTMHKICFLLFVLLCFPWGREAF